MDNQSDMDRNKQDIGKRLRQTAGAERTKNERLAKQLSAEAIQQWQRSITGLLALPTATALGLASTTLYVAALIERGFEVLQQSAEAVRMGLEEGRREFADLERTQPGSISGGAARSEGDRNAVHA